MNRQIRIWLVLLGSLLLSACIAPGEQFTDCSTTDPFSEEVQADSYWVSCELVITGSPDDIDKLLKVELPGIGLLQDVLELKEQDTQPLIPAELAEIPAFRYMLAVEWGFQSLPDEFVDEVMSANDNLSNRDINQIFSLLAKQFAASQSGNNTDRFQESLENLGIKISDAMTALVQSTIEDYSGIPIQEKLNNLIAQRYAIKTRPVSVSVVVQAINDFRLNDGKELFVFAEPNFITNLAPHIIGNGPFGAPVMATQFGVSNKEFQAQWAMQLIADKPLTQPDPLPIQSIAGKDRGQNVRVVLFDTSPVTAQQTIQFTQIDPPLQLTMLNPTLAALAAPPGSKAVNPRTNEHGLFVAGLVHAIVPKSQIYLVRTSQDAGHGTLYDLSKALLSEVFRARDDDVPNLVVNISGGVFCPANCWKELDALSCKSGKSENAKRCSEEVEEIAYLSIPLKVAEWLDVLEKKLTVVVVAAAGNDSPVSFGIYPPLLPMNPPNPPQRPAAYQHVLGVAATTRKDMRACYSNYVYRWAVDFDLAAPGGNGGIATLTEQISGTVVSLDYACAPLESTCQQSSDEATCLNDNGLISIVSDASGNGDDFAYWSGTSFATPLVSGVVALCLSRNVPVEMLASDASTPSSDITLLGRGRLRIPDSCQQ